MHLAGGGGRDRSRLHAQQGVPDRPHRPRLADARREIITKGSNADLSDALTDASTDGYEFGGESTKRKAKKRAVVRGSEELDTAQ